LPSSLSEKEDGWLGKIPRSIDNKLLWSPRLRRRVYLVENVDEARPTAYFNLFPGCVMTVWVMSRRVQRGYGTSNFYSDNKAWRSPGNKDPLCKFTRIFFYNGILRLPPVICQAHSWETRWINPLEMDVQSVR